MGRTGSAEKKADLEFVNMKRNPYLADYTEYKRVREQGTYQNGRYSQPARRPVPEDRRVVQWQAEGVAGRTNVQRNRAKKRAARRRRLLYRKIILLAAAGCVAFILLGGVFALKNLLQETSAGIDGSAGMTETENPDFDALSEEKIQGLSLTDYGRHPTWTEDFLTPNEYSRPGEPLEEVNSIFVHYTANKGTSAAQNRSYFEQLKDTHETSASAHFIIGYEGEIIQCVPLDEIAYAVQTRNYDSVSIECCYLESDGSFTQETYDSLLRLLRWLMDVYDLDTEDVLRHYDCGGKKCPLYYTDNPEEWEKLKREL